MGWRILVCRLVAIVAFLISLACLLPEDADERSLIVALHAAPQSLDPHQQIDLASSIVLGNIYETLVRFDADMRLEPMLAKSWSNPDDLTWRFELRDDVVFHDARTMSADDVVASFERARNLERVSSLRMVTDIRAAGPLVVEVETREPDPLLINRLPSLMVTSGVGELVGSGRYRLMSATDSQIDLEGFDNHRDGRPPFRRVRFEVVADAGDRAARVLDGRADLAGRLTESQLELISGAEQVQEISRAGLQVSLIMLRSDVPPFDQKVVREAFDLALDRTTLATVSGGVARRQLVGPHVFGFNPDLEAGAGDPEAARRLLAAAGYPDGLGVHLAISQGVDLAEHVAQLERVGIRARVAASPFPELIEQLEGGEFEATYFSCLSSTGDALDLLEGIAHSPTDDGRFGSSNWTGFVDPELDELIEQAGRLLDPVDRRDFLQQALARLDQSKTILPIVSQMDRYVAKSNLRFVPRLDGRIFAAEISLDQ